MQTLIKRLLTKYEVFTKLSQILHTYKSDGGQM